MHLWPPPASGGEILHRRKHPSLTVCQCHQSQWRATVNILSEAVCVSVCAVSLHVTGTRDNVQWHQLMVSLLALWVHDIKRQDTLTVKVSWLKINLSLGHPVKKTRGWYYALLFLTNTHWRNTLSARRLSTVGCPCQNSEPAARLTLRSMEATGTVAMSLLHGATKQLQRIAAFETNEEAKVKHHQAP